MTQAEATDLRIPPCFCDDKRHLAFAPPPNPARGSQQSNYRESNSSRESRDHFRAVVILRAGNIGVNARGG
jgi:hypothetical protein